MSEHHIESEARLTFWEAAGIIVGHGVGSGILAVPYLASRNSWHDIILTAIICWCINLVLHLMIAELSLNNDGAQFIKCFEHELFRGKLKKAATLICFLFLGLSVLVNVSGYIAGSGAVFHAWFHMSETAGMILYYLIASLVVLFGMKVVGICEKYSMAAMSAVIVILLIAAVKSPSLPMQNHFIASSNVLALYSMIAFSLSAVMSVPQVVKGLDGDRKKITGSIAAGTGINLSLILLITFTTILGAGSSISQNGALVDLAQKLGGWVSIIGYVFSLLALSTSFWANTLNLRDIIHEQTGWSIKTSFLACSLPSLILALLDVENFVGFTRLASVIQVLTGLAIIVSYSRSRKREGKSEICGILGTLPFQILTAVSSMLATAGALVHIL